MDEITILGEEVETGAYILRISMTEDRLVRFGRFQQGRPIFVPSAEYLYVGSAMAGRGSMNLARRLLRHATRQNQARPHDIRQRLLVAFRASGLGPENLQPPEKKKLFWNIDYLLEREAAILSHVVILRSQTNLEDALANFLVDQPGSHILANRLGAQDKRSQTHLLVIEETSAWWQQLPAALRRFVT